MLRARRLSLVALLLIGCGLASCSLPEGDYFGEVASSPDPSHLRWCNSGEPEYVDPALVTSTTGTPLTRLMFAGLAEYGLDASGTPEPSIATSWDISADQRRFTFHLRRDALWSNGRRLDAFDFLYHTARILHPTTLSRNQAAIEYIKNAKVYAQGRLRTLQANVPPFRAGDIVEVVGMDGAVADDLSTATLPSSNLRRSSKTLHLRDYGADESEAYAKVPAGEQVEIIELRTGWSTWAYVFYMGDEWRYGWVPVSELDIEPGAALRYTIRDIPPEQRLGVSLVASPDAPLRQGVAEGKALLMLPEALGISAPDAFTVVVETSSPTPFLIDEAATRSFRPGPRESISRSPLQWTHPETGLVVSSGAFHLQEWHARDKLEFRKSPTYFGKDQVRLERITVLSIDDQAASTNIYFRGGCDAIAANNIPYSYLPSLSGAKRGGRAYKDFVMAPYDGVYFFIINTEKMSNRHLRRALTMSIDREPIPRILHGGEIPSSQFIPGQAIADLSPSELALCGLTHDQPGLARIVAKDQFCYVPPKGLDFDPEAARKELALAKAEMGSAFPSTMDFKYNTGSESHKVIAEYVQAEWKNHLGLDIKLSTMEWKTFLKETSSGNYYIARLGWIGGSPDPEAEFHHIFKCGGAYNRSRWCNKDYDALLDQAAAMVDRKERLQTLQRAEDILLQDAPLIPLYAYTQKLLTKPYVRDLPINMGARPPLHRAWIDPNWQKASKP